ncbi:hypothetical protein HG442_001460 [Candidatus Gracilibacteria bacterium]|nr:hypothetical protein [Candidatus Gracilibacteria bacterium]
MSRKNRKIAFDPEEQILQTKEFFLSEGRKNSNAVLSDVAHRIYGILSFEKLSETSRNSLKNASNTADFHEALTNILHHTKNLANMLAYRSHNGMHWQRDSAHKMKQHLFHQFSGGRAAEIILCEAMMQCDPQSFHFLPVKELDLNYKTDMISRVPYHQNNALKTLAIGAQITTAPIDTISENFHKYEEKLEQMRAVVPFLESNQTQRDLKNRFGRLTTPDMMSYIALNGELRKIFAQNSNYSETKFQEWKSKNFEGNGLLERFKNGYREDFRVIAEEISRAQHLIVRPFFLEKIQENFEEKSSFYAIYERNLSFNSEANELTLSIKKLDETIARAIFFITSKMQKKLEKIHTKKSAR